MESLSNLPLAVATSWLAEFRVRPDLWAYAAQLYAAATSWLSESVVRPDLWAYATQLHAAATSWLSDAVQLELSSLRGSNAPFLTIFDLPQGPRFVYDSDKKTLLFPEQKRVNRLSIHP